MASEKMQQVLNNTRNTNRRCNFLPIVRIKTCFGLQLKTASFCIGYFQIACCTFALFQCGEVISTVLLRTGVDPLGNVPASNAHTSYITGIFWFFILNLILIVGLHTEILTLLRIYYLIQLAHVVLGSLFALVLLSLVNFVVGIMLCMTLLILFFYVVVTRSTCLYLEQKKRVMKARQAMRDKDNQMRKRSPSRESTRISHSSLQASSKNPDGKSIISIKR